MPHVLSARETVERSRWVVSKPAFRALLRRRGLTQKQIASTMGFGRESSDPANAQSTLSSLLRSGAATKGERVMLAARALDVSPYEFAQPVRCVDPEALAYAVAVWIDPHGLMRGREHAVIMACKALYDAGVDASLNEIESEVRAMLRRQDISYDEPADVEPGALRPWVMRVLQAYNAYTHIAGAARSGEKYAVDVTGLQTNFENWMRPEYAAILQCDRAYLAAASGLASQRITRTFVIDPRVLPLDAIPRLKIVLSNHVATGADIRIRLEDRQKVDREFVADLAVIGEYALDFDYLEAPQNAFRRARIADLFVHRSDTKRFNDIKRRVEWVRDRKESDIALSRLDQIDECLRELSLARGS